MATGVPHTFDEARFLSNIGGITGGAVYFYYTGTTNPAPIYTDINLTTPATNPVIVANGAILPNLYLDPTITYRRRILFMDSTVQDVDPLPVPGVSPVALGATTGASLVGYSPSATYPVGTVGYKLQETISVKDFGAKGDGVTDDRAAIQAALDFAGTGGGGVKVRLPRGNYRITSGLKLPSYVGIYGDTPSRYPYAASNPNISKIIADFTDPNQWVVEPKVTISGTPIAYNVIVAGSLPNGACYNCSVEDLMITSVNALPYGGIRMHGAPGGIVRDVSVYRVGCGLLVNYSFGGAYECHLHTAYYGAAIWGEANANRVEVYCARMPAYTGVVPTGYLLPFMSSLNGILTTTYKLSTNAHYQRSIGLMVGSLASTTANVRVVEATCERFEDGAFFLNSYSTFVGGLYVEGSTSEVSHGVIASNCTLSVSAIHQFLSGTGALFDFGNNVDAYINYNGSGFAAGFGKLPEVETASELRLGTLKPGFMSLANQFNVKFPDKDGDWITPTLTGATILTTPNNPFAYRINRNGKVEVRGGLTGISGTPTVFTFPAGFRPYYRQMFNGFGGTADVHGSIEGGAEPGKFVITSGGPTIIFDDKSFDQQS